MPKFLTTEAEHEQYYTFKELVQEVGATEYFVRIALAALQERYAGTDNKFLPVESLKNRRTSFYNKDIVQAIQEYIVGLPR